MQNPTTSTNSLEEIDARQDEVLRQIDQLNTQVERVLGDLLNERRIEPQSASGDASYNLVVPL